MSSVRDVLDSGKLSSYASTTAENSFFDAFEVTNTQYAPLWLAPVNGYNSGNTLLCLLSIDFVSFLTLSQL
jgi:hypothetical protein